MVGAMVPAGPAGGRVGRRAALARPGPDRPRYAEGPRRRVADRAGSRPGERPARRRPGRREGRGPRRRPSRTGSGTRAADDAAPKPGDASVPEVAGSDRRGRVAAVRERLAALEGFPSPTSSARRPRRLPAEVVDRHLELVTDVLARARGAVPVGGAW